MSAKTVCYADPNIDPGSITAVRSRWQSDPGRALGTMVMTTVSWGQGGHARPVVALTMTTHRGDAGQSRTMKASDCCPIPIVAPYRGHHGKGGFHCHPHVPLSPSADLDVGLAPLVQARGRLWHGESRYRPGSASVRRSVPADVGRSGRADWSKIGAAWQSHHSIAGPRGVFKTISNWQQRFLRTFRSSPPFVDPSVELGYLTGFFWNPYLPVLLGKEWLHGKGLGPVGGGWQQFFRLECLSRVGEDDSACLHVALAGIASSFPGKPFGFVTDFAVCEEVSATCGAEREAILATIRL